MLFLSLFFGAAMSAFTSAGYLMISHDSGSNKVLVHSNHRGKTVPAIEKTVSESTINEFLIQKEEKVIHKPVELKDTPKDSKNIEPQIKTSSLPTRQPGDKAKGAEEEITITSFDNDMIFEAKCIDNKSCIFWVTNTDSFRKLELERSANNGEFRKIEITPEVKSAEGKQYYLVTLDENESAANNRFRLKEVLNAKNIAYSDPVHAASCSDGITEPQIDVFPVGYGSFKITVLSLKKDHYTVTLTNLNEIEIINESFDVVKGENEYTLESGTLPRGVYNLKVSNGTLVKEKTITLK